MKKLLLYLIVSVVTVISHAQEYVAPSADAMGLVRYANTPVNLYTGTPQISIPLMEAVGNKLKVPVGLTYNGSGVKVQDVASVVGLGWTLNAGGVITRMVRGIPDDLTNGYCQSNPTDAEPDLYFFNFLGMTGKFVLDKFGNALTIPYQDIDIKPGICATGSTGGWEIKDANGVIYKFGSTASSREETTSKKVTSSTTTTFISSWMLDEIIDPDQTESIQFSYATSFYSFTNYYFTKYEHLNWDCEGSTSLKDESTVVSVHAKRISSITFSLGIVLFGWAWEREDLPGAYALTSIELRNQTQQISKVNLKYGYFQSAGCETQLCKRLRLDKIYDLAPDPLFSFTYNEAVNLPARNSKNFDHWGYYNSNTVDDWMPEIIKTDGTLFMSGASRESDAQRCLANIITQVDQRGGGSRKFTFEAHQVYKDANITIGGARIKNIKTNDGAGNEYTTSYSYVSESDPLRSSGQRFKKPFNMLYYSRSGAENGVDVTPTTATSQILLLRRFSLPYSEMFDLNGMHVGYSRVEEVTSGSGKTVYYFSNYSDHPDEVAERSISTTSKSWERGNIDSVSVYTENNALLTKQVNEYDYNLPNKASFDNTNTYLLLTVDCQHCDPWPFCSNVELSVASGGFSVISRPFVLKKQTMNIYDPSDSDRKMMQVAEYSYDPITFQLTNTTKYDAGRPSIKYSTEVKYVTHPDYNYLPYCETQFLECRSLCDSAPDKIACFEECASQRDYCLNEPPSSTQVAAIVTLNDRHQINVPIETITTIEENGSVKILSSNLQLFKLEGSSSNIVVPAELWDMRTAWNASNFSTSRATSGGGFSFENNKMKKRKTFNTYDQITGNVLQSTSFNGIVTNYAYDNNDLMSSMTTTGENLSRQTGYSYLPLVGQTSVTDANGIVTEYQYDVHNRLSVVKDQHGIVKRYRYHYKGETPGFKLSASKIRGVVNESFGFYVADIAASTGGAPRFVWDLGDGTVIDNNSLNVSKSYSAAGTYTVKLTGLSPEYGPTTRTVQVEIYNPLSVIQCMDGPISVDRCGLDDPGYGSCTPVERRNPESELLLTAETDGGCASSENPHTFYWEYRKTGNSLWSSLGSDQTITFPIPEYVGTFEIRCAVTDACSALVEAFSYVTVYESTDCPEMR